MDRIERIKEILDPWISLLVIHCHQQETEQRKGQSANPVHYIIDVPQDCVIFCHPEKKCLPKIGIDHRAILHHIGGTQHGGKEYVRKMVNQHTDDGNYL